MLVTSHVAAGALLATALPGTPAAFAAGVASHFAMDALPHWGDPSLDFRDPAFLRVAVADGLCGLAAMAVLTAAAAPRDRPRVWAGMVGAALPDIDKPALVFLGVNPLPPAVQRFHGAIQREDPGRLPMEAAATAGLVVLSVLAVRALGRRG